MQWYWNVSNKMVMGKTYSHQTIVSWLRQERPNLSNGGYHWAIDQLIRQGEIEKNGHDEYSKTGKNRRAAYIPIYSDEAQSILAKLSEIYPHVSFTVFETILMNSFLNHLVGQNTIFLQVEKESGIYLFRHLQKENNLKLLYKPGMKDFHLYRENNSVIITDLISEAPLRKDQPHSIMLEKMLVDMCADKLIASTFSKAELPAVFEQALSQYAIDRAKMTRYARRRNRNLEVRGYMEGAENYAEG